MRHPRRPRRNAAPLAVVEHHAAERKCARHARGMRSRPLNAAAFDAFCADPKRQALVKRLLDSLD